MWGFPVNFPWIQSIEQSTPHVVTNCRLTVTMRAKLFIFLSNRANCASVGIKIQQTYILCGGCRYMQEVRAVKLRWHSDCSVCLLRVLLLKPAQGQGGTAASMVPLKRFGHLFCIHCFGLALITCKEDCLIMRCISSHKVYQTRFAHQRYPKIA